MDFWDSAQRKGANFFNRTPREARFRAAGELGLEFIRLVPDKWEGEERDFLIGDAENFTAIPEKDMQELKLRLDQAHENGLKVVLCMLSLPGCRWVQNNGNKEHKDLWLYEMYQKQALKFWSQVAKELKDNPAVYGYDLLNEPHPGRAVGGLNDPGTPAYDRWFDKVRGTPADVNRFNARAIKAIRRHDRNTPIILETSTQAAYLIPMAISLGFGIVFATAIILVLVPCLYMVREDLMTWMAGEPAKT